MPVITPSITTREAVDDQRDARREVADLHPGPQRLRDRHLAAVEEVERHQQRDDRRAADRSRADDRDR